MKSKVKMSFSKVSIDTLILLLLFFQITLFSLLDIRGLGNRLILAAVIVRLFLLIKLGTYQLKVLGMFLAIVLSFTISALKGKELSGEIYYGNLMAIVYTLAPVVYIAWLCIHRKDYFFDTFEKCFYFFNVFYVANYALMLIQGIVPGFLSGLSDHVNTYKQDLMSGFFGYEGTAQFGVYSIFIILYDFYCFKYSRKNKIMNPIKRKVAMLLLTASVVIAAALNDNKAVYISLLIVLLQYYLFFSSSFKITGRIWTIIGLMIGTISMFLLVLYVFSTDLSFFYSISPELGGTVYLLRKLLRDITTYKSGEIGSIERVYMLVYMYFHPEYIPFGVGTGYSYWQTPGTLGFPHFGQSDMSSFLCLGGIFFCVICYYVYFYYYKQIIGKTTHNYWICLIAHGGCVLFYYFYTQPWTQSTLSICVAFMFVPFGMLTAKIRSRDGIARS